MKLSKQQVGLMVVLCGGVCAIGVDRFVLRPEGGLSNAAASVAAVAESALSGPAPKIAAKEVVDRSSAAIADRLEKLPLEAVTVSRDAFSDPWDNPTTQAQTEETAQVPVAVVPKVAPWTLTSVTSIGGHIAVVLNRDIVLSDGNQSRNDEKHVELISARLQGKSQNEGPSAIVRDTATGEEYLLVLGTPGVPVKH